MKVPFDTLPKWRPAANTLLTGYKPYAASKSLDFDNQSAWLIDDWKEYARLLNQELAASNEKLADCCNELADCKKKAGRRTTPIKHREGSLLTGYEQPRKGRKKGGGNCHEHALLALELKSKYLISKIKRSDASCAEEILIPLYRSEHRARGKIRGVVNMMGKLRKNNI